MTQLNSSKTCFPQVEKILPPVAEAHVESDERQLCSKLCNVKAILRSFYQNSLAYKTAIEVVRGQH